MLHINAKLTLSAFCKKAGWPGLRAIRLVRLRRINWQVFFSTSASILIKLFVTVRLR